MYKCRKYKKYKKIKQIDLLNVLKRNIKECFLNREINDKKHGKILLGSQVLYRFKEDVVSTSKKLDQSMPEIFILDLSKRLSYPYLVLFDLLREIDLGGKKIDQIFIFGQGNYIFLEKNV